jgi:hypothetical protein
MEIKSLSWGFSSRTKKKTLHIETPLGIVNITTGLSDNEGNEVEHIELLPTEEEGVILDGHINNRFIKKKIV